MEGFSTCERNRQKVARYYAKNRDTIIAHKTLVRAARDGRVPRESTLTAHSIDQDLLRAILKRFATEHPGTRAARKILRNKY